LELSTLSRKMFAVTVRRRIIRNFTYINLREIKNGIQDQIFAPLYIVMILQVNMRGNVQ